MQKIYILFVFCLLAAGLHAQQEEQYTQFMYNKLMLNPGYAGSQDGAVISLEEKGTMAIKPNGDGQLYLTMNFSTAHPEYQWLNDKQVWGTGISFLSEGEGRVTISGFGPSA